MPKPEAGGISFSRAVLAAAMIYFLALLLLTDLRPLWLDELVQLVVSGRAPAAVRWDLIRHTSGQVPFSYDVEHWVMSVVRRPDFSARLAPEVFSVAAAMVLTILGRNLGLKGALWMMLLWGLLPLQLRYAVEGRPYAQALFFAALATLLFERLVRKPGLKFAAAYGIVNALTLYTQPYAVFLQAGLCAALLFEWSDSLKRRSLLNAVGGLACAALLFAPWLLYAIGTWQADVRERYLVTGRVALMILREISGAGYVCSLLLLGVAGIGVWLGSFGREWKRALVLATGVMIVAPIFVDLWFGYFFAIRQVIYALIPLSVLALEGWFAIWTRWGKYAAWLALAVFAVPAIAKDSSYFRDRSENWQPAAQRLRLLSRDGCVWYGDKDSGEIYEYLEPELIPRNCRGVAKGNLIYFPSSPFTPIGVRDQVKTALKNAGFHLKTITRSGKFAVDEFGK